MDSDGIKILPKEGMIPLAELAKFFGVRNDVLRRMMAKKGIPIKGISTHSRFQLVDVADLTKLTGGMENTPKGMENTPEKPENKVVQPKEGAQPGEGKKAPKTLQEIKERIRLDSGNPDKDRQLKDELMLPNDCFGEMYGKGEACQNCTIMAEYDGYKYPLKVFCEALSPAEAK